MSTRTDEPTGKDLLGRETYTSSLAEIAMTSQTPLVIGIFGGWGSGKTSLMMQIQEHIRSTDTANITTIWFNPWKHQFDHAPMIPLLHEIRRSFPESDQAKFKRLKLFTLIGKILGEMVLRTATSGTVQMDDILTRTDRQQAEYFEARSIAERLQEHFEDAVSELVGKDGRLVFFIDDLDRCLPETALRVLEALKLFLNSERCVYFLALDKQTVDHAVKAHYENSGVKSPDYLDKIIQLPFEIPAIVDERVEEYIEKLTDDKALGEHSKLIAWGVDRNPRTAKRYMNALYLLHTIGKKVIGQYNPAILIKVLILQLRFHDFYRHLVERPELMTEMEHFILANKKGKQTAKSRKPPSTIESFAEDTKLTEFLLLDRDSLVSSMPNLNLKEYLHLMQLSKVEPSVVERKGETLHYGQGKRLRLDEDGFVQEPEMWDGELAAALAQTEDVDSLTDEHWKVINYIRDYYLKFGVAPMIRKLCKETGFPLRKIYELFPSGPAKGACKVAGLRKPTGCV